MGHYDDHYAAEDLARRDHIALKNAEATELLQKARRLAIPANTEQFNIKFKEMLFWMENE